MKDKLYTGRKRIIRKYIKEHEKDLSKLFKEGGEITKEFMELLGFDIVEWEVRGAFPPLKQDNKYHCVKRFGNKMTLAFDIVLDSGEFVAEYSCYNKAFLKKARGRDILRFMPKGVLRCPGDIINIINEICMIGDSNYMKTMYD